MTPRAAAVVAGFERLHLEYLAYLPSSSIAPIIDHFIERNGQPGAPVAFPISREEEGVGIVGGLALAGRRAAMLIQDNGFGNSLTALTTFAAAYDVPLPIYANTRGGLGEYNSMIHVFSGSAPAILAAAGLPVFRVDRRNTPADWEATVIETSRHATMTHRPVVLLLDFWAPAEQEDARP